VQLIKIKLKWSNTNKTYSIFTHQSLSWGKTDRTYSRIFDRRRIKEISRVL